jgi:hypothetical protein
MRHSDLAADLDVLLGDLCIHWGFCNRLSGADLMRGRHSLTCDDFAHAVLTAEGMIPEYEKKWVREIKRRFTDRYGHSTTSHHGH